MSIEIVLIDNYDSVEMVEAFDSNLNISCLLEENFHNISVMWMNLSNRKREREVMKSDMLSCLWDS